MNENTRHDSENTFEMWQWGPKDDVSKSYNEYCKTSCPTKCRNKKKFQVLLLTQ
jgi:hypothetical protein